MKTDLYSRGFAMLQRGMTLEEITAELGLHDTEALLAGTCLRDLGLPARIETVIDIVVHGDADADEAAFSHRVGTWFRERPGYVPARRALGL